MNIKPIKTKSDYKASLKAVESLMSERANTPEGDRLDVLVTLVEAYERKHFPMDLPDAVEAIKFRMEQQDLSAKDLEPLIGAATIVNEVLNRKRGLTLAMIQKLHGGWASRPKACSSKPQRPPEPPRVRQGSPTPGFRNS